MNHLDIVHRVAARQSPGHTLESSMAFTLAVLAALPPNEQAGLKKSSSGASSTLAYRGTFVRVNRISYPDGITYKILTDTPGTNGLAWNLEDGGALDPDAYVALDSDASEPDEPPAAPSGWRPYVGDDAVQALSRVIDADYREAGRDGLDAGSFAWAFRVIWDHIVGDEHKKVYTLEASIAKHRGEWRRELGLR